MVREEQSEEFHRLGVSLSVVGHILLFAIVFSRFSSGWGEFSQPIVYSVTIEGGKKLGGRTQVPTKDEKAPVAPPKNVSSPDKQEEKKPEVKDLEKPKEQPKIPEADKGEVQIKKKDTKVEEKKPPKKDEKKAKEKPVDPNKQYQDAMQRYFGESANAGGTSYGAAALGGKGMGGGKLTSKEHILYAQQATDYIKSGWVWTTPSSGLSADITFSVSATGKIGDATITKGSGNRAYDDSVLRAVAKADPLPAPPSSIMDVLNPFTITFRDTDSR